MPETIRIHPWPDPVIEALGFDPRSAYCERFWLPSIGPTALLLMRHFAGYFDERPEGGEVGIAELAQSLGLGTGAGPNAPVGRTLGRLVQFDLAQPDEGALAVRRRVPPINRRHLRRLPAHLQQAHADLMAAQVNDPPDQVARRNARRLALTMVEQGEDLDTVERTLAAAGYPCALRRECAGWAWDQHRGRAA